jgi:hypothetical protein
MRRTIVTISLAFALATGSGSCGSRHSPPEAHTQSGAPAGDKMPSAAPWSVRVGEVGGFTGGGGGHIIRSDGTVTRWTRVTPQDSIESSLVGKSTSGAIRDLRAALASPDLAALSFERSGNMTAFLEWVGPPQPRRWTWSEGTKDAELPAALRQAYLAALAAVAAARP